MPRHHQIVTAKPRAKKPRQSAGEALRARARENVDAFVRTLKLSRPAVEVVSRPRGRADECGRYEFTLRRGVRAVEVWMPREVPGAAWFPRLFVDGNSWLWEYAVDVARDLLRDPSGAQEARDRAREEAVEADVKRNPRCAACGSIRSRVRDVRHVLRATCVTCEPRFHTERAMTSSGAEYLVRYQYLPLEAVGEVDDPVCNGRYCRLKRGHRGKCESYLKEISRRRIAADEARTLRP